MPKKYGAYGESWLHWHSRWRMVTWTEENLPILRNQLQFDNATLWAQKSDIARYEIIHRYGGVYLDTDFECLKNIEELLSGIDFFAATEDGRWVSTGIFGSVPQHPLLADVISAIIDCRLPGGPAE
jgi:inositol phosphorylceramide mannosyltransferase catalytic subunit